MSLESAFFFSGRFIVMMTTGNVVGTELSGPYSALKAIGPRVSYKDRGLTFGSNAARGVCIKFREPVHGIEPTGRLVRHPGLTVTVADVDGLAAELASLT